MKNLGQRVAATAMLVAGLTVGAVPAFAAAGAAGAPTAAQERLTVTQCLSKADLSAAAACLQDARTAGRLTGRTDIAAVVAQERQQRAAAAQAAAAQVAATQTAAPQPASARLAADPTTTAADPGGSLCTPPETFDATTQQCVKPGNPTPGGGGVGGGGGGGGSNCVPPQVLSDAGICISVPSTESPSPSTPGTPVSTPTGGGLPIPPTPGGGSGGGGGGGGSTGGGGGGGGSTGGGGQGGVSQGGVSTGNGSGVDGAGTSPEGVVSSRAQTTVPVNSACSDAAICQAAAAPTTSTSSTSSANGLADTGAPAHAEGYLALGAALVLGGGLVLSRPRRAAVEA